MNHILSLLRHLDEVYHIGNLQAYEQRLQDTAEQVHQTFPGFTVAFAEIATVGAQRDLHDGMRHVLIPQPACPHGQS